MFDESKRSQEGYFVNTCYWYSHIVSKKPPGHVYCLVLEWYLVPRNKIFRYFVLGKWKCEEGGQGWNQDMSYGLWVGSNIEFWPNIIFVWGEKNCLQNFLKIN